MAPNKYYLISSLPLVVTGVWLACQAASAANSQTRGTLIENSNLLPVTQSTWWQRRDDEASLHVIVNKSLQQVKVYSDGKFVSMSNVSTGKLGNETPGGIFSILGKRRFHRSNIYSRAPMPFMQRLTWSGIALHESKSVPPYPASHGCVRLPGGFADNLFQFTEIGAQVIITDRDVRPQKFTSQKMFSIPLPGSMSVAQLRPTTDNLASDSSRTENKTKKPSPIRVLITRRTGREKVMEIQSILAELKYLDGDIDGWMGPDTGGAITRFQKDYKHKVSGSLTPELLGQLYRATGKGKPRLAHLYVRQDQKPLFDASIVLADPDASLGTHHLMAIGKPGGASNSASGTHWLSVSIEETNWKKSGPSPDEGMIISPPPSSAKTALERFTIPKGIHERVSALMIPGSTVIISDQGLSKETGKGTDFIVLTR